METAFPTRLYSCRLGFLHRSARRVVRYSVLLDAKPITIPYERQIHEAQLYRGNSQQQRMTSHGEYNNKGESQQTVDRHNREAAVSNRC